ncbi:phage portal protein, HK97 family [Paenarthrobacter nicotinovorans]|nr:phage portal protein, HK97 family [Paenarthrobacter nicotinovorans]
MYGLGVEGCVSRTAALSVATVAGARDVLTGRVSRCPLVELDASGKPVARPSSLLSQPERGTPRSQSIIRLLDALFFDGRAFWKILEWDASGFPSRVQFIPEHEAETNAAGQMIRAYGETVEPRASVRFDGPHNGLLKRGSDTIRRAIRINRAAAKAEDNPVPALEIHNEGEDPSAAEGGPKALVDKFIKARATTGVSYTSKGLKLNTHGQHPEALMIDSRRAITLELLRHAGAGANPEIVSAAIEGKSLNYTNQASREAALIDNFLAPYMTAIEDRLSMDDMRPHGRTVLFDTDVLTRDDTATRYGNYKLAKELEIMSTEDIKAAEAKKVGR